MCQPLQGHLHEQADACARMGSLMYATLLRRVAGGLDHDGPVRRVLTPHTDASGRAATGLRLLGAVHRLVLERRAGELAVYYPSVGGEFELEAAWPAFEAVVDDHAETVAELMRRPPQTNEVGRAAALIGALLRLAPGRGASQGLPIRLHELGASAGLNLRADRFRYVGAGGAWGRADSPVQLEPAWRGVMTPVETQLDVAHRVGCDPDPIDPTSAEGRLLLTAYVWADQPARMERLRGALAVAAQVPATVHRQHAVELVASMHPERGALTMLWHSVMWQYLGQAEQDDVRAHIHRLGAAATEDAPFAYVRLEPRPRGLIGNQLVRAQTWPGDGRETVLGSAPGHGVPVDWER